MRTAKVLLVAVQRNKQLLSLTIIFFNHFCFVVIIYISGNTHLQRI